MGTRNNSDFSLSILEYMSSLRRYALVLTKSADGANDLVQDCIERALSKEHLYQQGTNLRAWLFTIMRNIFITEIRKTNFRRTYAQNHLVTGQLQSLPNQFHSVALKESLELMKQLSAGEREAVTLLGIFDLSYKEAALQSGAQIGTLKSRSSRGRTHLKILSEPDAIARMSAGPAAYRGAKQATR